MTINRTLPQLILIGNGFDLECRLQSSFSSFLLPRIGRLMQALESAPNRTPCCIPTESWGGAIKHSGLTIWDGILFSMSGIPRGFTGSWQDCEQISEFLKHRDGNNLFSWADLETQVDSVVRYPKSPCSPETLGNLIRSRYCPSPLGKRRVLSGEAAYCYQVLGDRAFHPARVERFMLDELYRLERELREYLIGCIRNCPNYGRVSSRLLRALIHAELGEYASGTPQTNVLSFNYTKPTDDTLKKCHVISFKNVHGSLGDKNIIVGVDGRLPGPFSKTARRLRAGITSNPADLVFIDDGNGHARRIKLIKVFGHSLNLADYLYYQEIFNKADYLNNDMRIVFYLYDLDGESGKRERDAVRGLMTEYGRSLGVPAPEDLAEKLQSNGKLIIRDSSFVAHATMSH